MLRRGLWVKGMVTYLAPTYLIAFRELKSWSGMDELRGTDSNGNGDSGDDDDNFSLSSLMTPAVSVSGFLMRRRRVMATK